jgi:hypothetical protein
LLTLAYYLPLVEAIREREFERVDLDDSGTDYIQAAFAEVDISLAVRSDLFTLVTAASDGIGAGFASSNRSAGQLYELVMAKDAVVADLRDGEAIESGTDSFFIGGDGIAVTLGGSWRMWSEQELGR